MSLGLIVVCALAAGALALPPQRLRAQAALGALVLTPILLLVQVRDTSAVHRLLDRPLVFAAAVLVGLAVVAGGARLVHARPAWLPLVAVAALPFRIPISAGGSTSNLLVPLYLVVGAGVLAWAIGVLRRPEQAVREAWDGEGEPPARPVSLAARRTEPGVIERLLAAGLILYALQSTYTDDLDRAAENVLFFYVPFALLFVLLVQAVTWTPQTLKRCLGVLVALALALAAVGFVEYATRHLFLNPKVIASNQFEDYFRVNSLFFDPNIYGRFLALVMLGVGTVLLWTRDTRATYVAGGLLAVLWAGMVTSLSQSSFTALLVGLAVLAGLRWRPRIALGAAAGLAAIGVAFVLLAPGAIGLDLGDASSRENATSGRGDLVRGGLELAGNRPLEGYGAGAFSRAYRRDVDGSEQKAVSASHTIPITVAAEQGIVGLVLYLALVVAALRRLGRTARDDPYRAFVLAAFAALLVHTLLYAAFLEDPLTWALLGVGSALAAAAPPRHRSRLARPGGRRARPSEDPTAPAGAAERAAARRAAAAATDPAATKRRSAAERRAAARRAAADPTVGLEPQTPPAPNERTEAEETEDEEIAPEPGEVRSAAQKRAAARRAAAEQRDPTTGARRSAAEQRAAERAALRGDAGSSPTGRASAGGDAEPGAGERAALRDDAPGEQRSDAGGPPALRDDAEPDGPIRASRRATGSDPAGLPTSS